MEAFKNFRSYFFRGMAALLPTILTIWLFVQFYLFVQEKISSHINKFLVKIILAVTDHYSEQMLVAFWVDGRGQITGFVLALVGVVILGAFLASVFGRTLWRILEKAFFRAPLIRSVYPHIKQVTDFLLTKKDLSFNHVVAVQYPRERVWSVGLVTGTGLKKISDSGDKEFLTVFVPTSPTPFTGYVIMTAKEETIELDMTIEEAMRFTISGGVITPAEHRAFQASQQADGAKKLEGKH